MGRRNDDDFNDTVLSYYNSLASMSPISRVEEERLIALAKEGDDDAKNEVIKANLRFVFDVAKKYKGKGVPLADLISEGNMGLIKALDKFDLDKGTKFITYAVFWIRQAMIKSICTYLQRKERHLSVDDDEEDGIPVLTQVSSKLYEKDDDEENKEDVIDYFLENKNIIDEALSCLTPRERMIIERSYGINGYNEVTLKEIGDSEGITGERVRHIKQKAMRKMRSAVMNSMSF